MIEDAPDEPVDLSPTLGGLRAQAEDAEAPVEDAKAPAEEVEAPPEDEDVEEADLEVDELGPVIPPVPPPRPMPPPPYRPAPRPAPPRRPAAVAAIADAFDLTKFQARYQQAIKGCADVSLAVGALAVGMTFFFAGGGANFLYLVVAVVVMFVGLTVVMSGAAMGYLFVAGAANVVAGIFGAAFRGARRPGG